MTKYYEVANNLEKRIFQKEFSKQLPNEQQLAKQYQTSRVVISEALKVLKAKNLINTRKGSGIYLKKRDIQFPDRVEISANEHEGFHSSIDGRAKLTSHIISFSIRKPDEEEKEKLQLKKDDQVYDIIRQRLLNGKATKLEYTIMPVKVIPGITEKILHQSIYSYIRNTLHLKIGKADRVIVADKADAYDQTYLDCKADDAVLAVHQLAYLKDKRPFELSETRDRYDRTGYILVGVSNN